MIKDLASTMNRLTQMVMTRIHKLDEYLINNPSNPFSALDYNVDHINESKKLEEKSYDYLQMMDEYYTLATKHFFTTDIYNFTPNSSLYAMKRAHEKGLCERSRADECRLASVILDGHKDNYNMYTLTRGLSKLCEGHCIEGSISKKKLVRQTDLYNDIQYVNYSCFAVIDEYKNQIKKLKNSPQFLATEIGSLLNYSFDFDLIESYKVRVNNDIVEVTKDEKDYIEDITNIIVRYKDIINYASKEKSIPNIQNELLYTAFIENLVDNVNDFNLDGIKKSIVALHKTNDLVK